MHILQISAPKSGSMWLHRILRSIFERAGLPQRSLIQNHPIYPLARTWDLSYAEQASIDMIDIEPLASYYRISSIFRMPITDFRNYVAQCSHVWTHSPLCPRSFELFPIFDKRVYIVRDPRDRAISASKFAFTPYMQKYYPHDEQNPERFLENQLAALTEEWRWHVGDHLRYAERLDVHFVFYERLLETFETELNALLHYLEIDLPIKERQAIRDEVDFTQMRHKNPQHVRRGTWGHWRQTLSEPQQQEVSRIAGPLLRLLGYTTDPGAPVELPRKPHPLTQRRVEETLGLA